MSHDELMKKRDLCFFAAEGCKSAKMWAVWIRKSNELRNKAMRIIENKPTFIPRIDGDAIYMIAIKDIISESNIIILCHNNIKYKCNKYGFVRYNKFYLLLNAIEKALK